MRFPRLRQTKCSHKKEVVTAEGFIALKSQWEAWLVKLKRTDLSPLFVMWVRECVYVDENRYIHQLTKIERTKQTNKTLRKGPLKVVNINCYVLQAEMFASLCLPTKHIFPIGHMPRVKRRTKSHLIRSWNRGKSDVPVAPSRKQFYLFTFFRCHIKVKNNYFINRFILESESITTTRLTLLFRNV